MACQVKCQDPCLESALNKMEEASYIQGRHNLTMNRGVLWVLEK